MINPRKRTSNCKTKVKGKKHFIKSNEVIPDSVYHAIRDLVDNHSGRKVNSCFNNCLKITARIYYQSVTSNGVSYTTHPFSKSYWDKVIGTHHIKFIKLLEEHNIIVKELIGRRNCYGIHTDLLLTPSTIDSYDYVLKDTASELDEPINVVVDRLRNRIIKNLEKVSIDNELFELVKKAELLKPEIDDYRVELTDLPEKFMHKSEIHYLEDIELKHVTIEILIKIINELEAKGVKRDTFYYGDRFLIDDPVNFLSRRYHHFLAYTSLAIVKVNSQLYHYSRDTTKTRRVFNVLTSLPSKVMPFVLIDNEPVVGIDVKTSQFSLLANLFNHFVESGDKIAYNFPDRRRTFIKKLYKCFETTVAENPELDAKDSVGKFSNDIFNEDFYTQIAKLIGLKHRSQAKIFCFSILFSSDKSHNMFKKKISERYPCVIKTLELYKKGNGKQEEYKRLSINLQALEAELFIDKIFNQLHREKIGCFTRHDSVIIKETDAQRAEQIIEDEYCKVGFTVKVDKEDYAGKRRGLERILNEPEGWSLAGCGDLLDYEEEEEIELIRNTMDDLGVKSLSNDQLLFLLNQGNKLLPANEYNHVESRVMENINNEFPLDDESINTLTLIADNI